MTSDLIQDAIDAWADALVSARRDAAPLQTALPNVLATGDILDHATAYRIQRSVTDRVSAISGLAGYKIGLTNPQTWQQLGINGPFAAPLYDCWAVGPEDRLDRNRLIAPRTELELVFRLAIDDPAPEAILAEPERVFDGVAAGFEIIDSRIADWQVGAFDLIADAGATGAFAVGLWQTWPKDGTGALGATILVDGVSVASGGSAACMGNPLNTVAALASMASERRFALRRGHIIFSGALCLWPGPWNGAKRLEGQITGMPPITLATR